MQRERYIYCKNVACWMFTNWAHPCDQCLGQETVLYQPPLCFPTSVSPQARHHPDSKPRVVLPGFGLYVNRITLHAPFCVWLLLLSILFVKFIPIAVCGCRLFILIALQKFTVGMCHDVFTCLLYCWWAFGGFPVLASTNSVAMNILAQVLTHACVSIGSLPQNGITESQDIHMLLWIPLNSFPKQLNFLAFLPDMCEKSYFLFSFMPRHKEEE